MSRLIVKNLPSGLSENELRKSFAKFGKVTDCKLMKTDKGKSRRFGFVGYHNEKHANKALETLNNTLMLNQKVCVEICKSFNEERKKVQKKNTTKEKETLPTIKSVKPVIEKASHEFWIKMRGCPFKVTNTEIEEFFFPINVKNIEILKNKTGNRSGFVLVEFDSEKDQNHAMKSNKDYLKGRYIELQIYRHFECNNNLTNKDEAKRKKKQTKYQEIKDVDVSESGRLFVRNLSFGCTEDELGEKFGEFGLLSENTIIWEKHTDTSLGYGYVTYVMPEHAVAAINALDGSVFQGRMLQVLPALPKANEDKLDIKHYQSSFKKQKAEEQQKNAQSSHNWNTLFIGGNAVADAVVERYQADKLDVLDSTKTHSAAVRLALGETEIVQETKKFLLDNNILLESFSRQDSARSTNVIIAKNLAASTTSGELRKRFDMHGRLKRLLLAPAGTTAIMEFSKSSDAKEAFVGQAYRNFHGKPLYLEWAPLDIFDGKTEAEKTKKEDVNKNETNSNKPTLSRMTLFVKNLNFETTQMEMKRHFEQIGPVTSCIISQKKDLSTNTLLSMGYGFVEFESKEDGLECLKKLQHVELDGHNLELKKSDKKLGERKQAQRKDDGNTEQGEDNNKILVRNIPFQANRQEIKSLFETYGELRTVRLPTKINENVNRNESLQHRGFAFVDFVTRECAKEAFKALSQSTHLYGRRLRLEWAKTESTSVDELRRKATESYNNMNKKQKITVNQFEENLNNAAAFEE